MSKKIMVLYPVLHYPPVIGGLEQWEQNIAERQGDDAEVIVVTGRVKGAPNFEQKNNVKIFRTSLFVLQDLSHSSWFYMLTAMPFIVIKSFGESGNMKIIHCHGFMSALVGWILSMFSNKPVICTEQSLGWTKEKTNWLRRVVYKSAKLCIASSEAVAEEFKSLGMDGSRIQIIPNGIDLKQFYSKDQCALCGTLDVPHKIASVSRTILSVGRLEKVKGHRYLIEAVHALRQLPDTGYQIRLVVIGDGSERANLEKQVFELNLGDVVKFVGEVPHEELAHYYHKADVFVMPSLSEGFGNTVLEAMACNIPIVASRVGGLIDLVSEEVGELVVPGDSSAITEAVQLVLDSQKSYSGSKKAQNYSWDEIAKQVGKIYAEEI